ncbi:VOC family protein [Agrococcus sp. SGAir0287]|uniref:VOC family protein n=1 Tax=Agrococcus sp. SGAir0287 TaxID=2070347 RepID=UPI0010CCD92A|nr:VOC family protein [Agrococcus sp. SGAir0287]QCR20010.1 glyoxalase [Agrococcus sp. SGAir0287]
MPLRWYTVVVETTDPARLGHWWAEALDWEVIYEADDEVVAIPRWAEELSASLPFHRQPPGLVFVRVDHEKTTKNRLHIDLAPHTSDDREAEIARLESLGATRVDVGQGPDVTWTVLADIDGNEFCVLSSRDQ